MKARPAIEQQVTPLEPMTEIQSKRVGRFPVAQEDRTVIVGAIAHTYRATSSAQSTYGGIRSEKDALAFRKRFSNKA